MVLSKWREKGIYTDHMGEGLPMLSQIIVPLELFVPSFPPYSSFTRNSGVSSSTKLLDQYTLYITTSSTLLHLVVQYRPNTKIPLPGSLKMFDHYRSMPVECEAVGCQEIVVGEDAWCGWCRKVQCRRHYDSKAHGCRYTNLVS
jgi:hypothetical protein